MAYQVQISSRQVFLDCVAKENVPVTVERTVTSVPVEEEGRFFFQQAIAMHYRIEFHCPERGPSVWTFLEVLRADSGGTIHMNSARLLSALTEADAEIRWQKTARSI